MLATVNRDLFSIHLSIMITIQKIVICICLTAILIAPKSETIISEEQYVFGSISFPEQTARFDKYTFQISPLEGKGRYSEVIVKSKNGLHNGQLNNGKTYLFYKKLPPGKYVIKEVKYHGVNDGSKPTYDRYYIYFTLNFEIEKNRTAYVGEITVNEYSKNRYDGLSSRNNFERDMLELRKRNIIIESEKVNSNFKFRNRL